MKNEYLDCVHKFKADKKKLDHFDPYYFHLQERGTEIYRNVCILGGGLAGYLTAIAFRKFFDIPVTVIESSKIPVIGVGEATTPLMEEYLFNVLELDKKEFFEKVEPTWKLGIKFMWGKPGDYFFNYPFDSKDILSSYIHTGTINNCSLNSLLMLHESSFVAKIEENHEVQFHSLSRHLKYAYHLDNQKFIAYLKGKAFEFGVEWIDAEIADCDMDAETGDITCLTSNKGEKYAYDFYVDCSGFRSFLLEKKLGASYLPYKGSLFNDTAVTGIIPHQGNVKCFTTAESMDNGWCWNIPLRHEDHRGYVFSSDFCSVDDAYAEMRRKNPTMKDDPKTVRFRSGRHSEFIKANVVGIGNSYAFVEPLESTGVHMIIDEIIVLMNNFMLLKNNPVVRNMINEDMNAHWDYIRWFLSIHYKFNRKFDTPYWQQCRAEADCSGFDEFIRLYKEVGFLSHQDTTLKNILRYKVKDTIFDLYGVDHILLGQGVLPDNLDRVQLANKEEWFETLHNWKKLQRYTIPVSEDLQVLLRENSLV